MSDATGVINLQLRELGQLFNSLDPSPFVEKDLDPRAEEYIVESFDELSPRRVRELVVHLHQIPGHPEAASDIESAIQDHFARQAARLHRDLRLLLRRGLVSLVIGLCFLGAVFGISEGVTRWLGEGQAARLFQQGLLIVGWVAMWRPLDIFLYDWWPILGKQRRYQQLSRIPVRLVTAAPREPQLRSAP